MIDLKGKKAVILGVGNNRSIAWAIAESLSAAGAEIALTYLPEKKGRYEAQVRKLAEAIKASIVEPCDVGEDASIDALFNTLEKKWGTLDVLVHSLAYADMQDLRGNFSDTSRTGYLKAQEISSYSLLPLSAKAAPLMRKAGGGCILTMTYVGSVLAVPNYNVMGPAKASLESNVRYLARELGADNIRVNGVSAGPIKTLSASGVKSFGELQDFAINRSAIKRAVEQTEVADTCAFLCTQSASAITGQVVYVDCGFNMMGG